MPLLPAPLECHNASACLWLGSALAIYLRQHHPQSYDGAPTSVLHSFHNCAPYLSTTSSTSAYHIQLEHPNIQHYASAHHNSQRDKVSQPPGSTHQLTMSSRFGRDTARDDLFSSYNRSASPSKSKNKARASPYNSTGGYGLPSNDGPAFSAYPGASTNGSLYGGSSYGASSTGGGYGIGGSGPSDGGYRTATPNSRGQYNSATLDELESQNEEQTGVLIGKVKMLKDVRPTLSFSRFSSRPAQIVAG